MLKLAHVTVAVVLAAVAVPAGAISVVLGAGTQNLTLYGQGPISPGVGSFRVGQGSSSFDGITSTFTFSGAITSGDAGYNSGTYSFVTTYAGANTPQAGPSAPFAQTSPSNINYFVYDALDSSTNITMFLNTPGHNYAIPLVTAGSFVTGTGFSFLFTTAVCTGVANCTQNGVGLTPGATISGPVTTSASFTMPTIAPGVPEPATWALLLSGFGMVGTAARRGRARRAVAI
jgi:hypothetical protein